MFDDPRREALTCRAKVFRAKADTACLSLCRVVPGSAPLTVLAAFSRLLAEPVIADLSEPGGCFSHELTVCISIYRAS